MTNFFTYVQAKEKLTEVLDRVSNKKEVVFIKRNKTEDVALISAKELSGLIETIHLLHSPAKAKRLLETLKESRKWRNQ